MIATVETSEGRKLKDQRGLYMYGDGWSMVPDKNAPKRYSLEQMVKYWEGCLEYGNYVLRISPD